MIRHSEPLTWSPHGVTDALDSSNTFRGAMAALTNLIGDPTTSDLWQGRPAAIRLTNFPQFNQPGFISCMKVVGDNIYGLLRTARTANFEEPFVFNLLTNSFATITGVTGLNVPAQVASSGAWVPPTIDVIGSKVVVTHPGFGATAFFFGWFDISNPAAITWNAGNTAGGVVLTTVPSFVAQFNGRAYYIVNLASQPAVVFSDPLNATQVTNASQVITFGDAVKLTALGQLRLWNQAGGIIQGLIVFKGVANCYQVTGDSALGTLAINALNVATGTLAPLAISATAKGLAFVSPDGIRVIDFQGSVSPGVGQDGKGVSVPFIFPVVSSRIVMACSGDTARVGVQNGAAPNQPFQEWWYDLSRQTWAGPHTFVPSLIQPYNNTFIVAPIAFPGTLYQSDPVQSVNSGFIEGVDTNAKVILNFDGANLSTVINDDAGNAGGSPHLWTATAPTALDTTTFKFGNASLKVQGGAGEGVSTSAVTDFNAGSANFSFEGQFSCTAASGTSKNIAGQTDAGDTAAGSAWRVTRDSVSNTIVFKLSNGAAYTTVTGTTQFDNATNLGFHHWAACRIGNVLRLFIDGIQEGGDVAFAGAVNVSAAPLMVGNRNAAGGAWIGWLDATRLTFGASKYTVNFPPPTAAPSFLGTTPLQFTYQTSFFPDLGTMSQVSMSQGLLHCALAANTAYTITIIDPNGTLLDTAQLSLSGTVAVWGAFNWGAPALWGGVGGQLLPRQIAWTHPVVFAKGQIAVQGPLSANLRIGQLFIRLKQLKYLTNLGAVG